VSQTVAQDALARQAEQAARAELDARRRRLGEIFDYRYGSP
jgi:hypothetical protein